MNIQHKNTIWNSVGVSILTFGLYAAVFLIAAPWLGGGTGILVTIPVLIMTWKYGIHFGIPGWICGVLLNVLLSALIGDPWQIGSTVGVSTLLVVVLAVGYMRETSLRLKQELSKRQQAENKLQALYNATSRLFGADNVLDLGEQIVQTVAREFNQMDCGILLSVPGSQAIRRLARTGAYMASPDQELQRDGEGLVPKAIRSGKLVYAPDVHDDPNYLSNVTSTRSELVIPLQTSKGVIGVLDLQSPIVDDFDKQTQRLLITYAGRAAAAIETQLLNDELQRHVSNLEWRVLQRTADVQRAKEQIETILSNSSDTIMLVSPEGIMQQVNPAFTHLTGYREADAIGKSLLMLCDIEDVLAQLKQDKQVVHIDTQIRRANGNLVDVDMMFSSIRDEQGQITAVVCNIHDITDRKRAMEAIRQSQAQLQAIMDNTQAIIYVKDLQGRYLLVNRQFEKDFHVSREDLRGKTDYDIFPESVADKFGAHDRQVLKAGTPLAFEESVLKDGRTHIYLSNKFPVVDAGGTVYGVCGISTDITIQKQVEDSLRTALTREQELNALKSNFIATVSHEFRTPLAVIGASSDLLTAYYERLSEEKRKQKLNTIQTQVARLTHLMNEVLVMSEAETAGLKFEPAPTDVLDLCQSIIEETDMTYDNEVEIDFVHQGIQGSYLIDEHLLRHIIQNLLSNAIKYSKPQTTVSVQVCYSDSRLKFVVRDQGIGIPEADQKKLFKSFHRASNVNNIQGTGLGLAIVKHAVDKHQGTITCESVEGQGTTFVVILPAERLFETVKVRQNSQSTIDLTC